MKRFVSSRRTTVEVSACLTREAALARPARYAHYEHADLSLQAAALAHGIAEGQLFIEGNKRVALAALRTFLLVNGLQIDASQEERARWILTQPSPSSPEC